MRTGSKLVLAPDVLLDLFYASQAGEHDLEGAFFDEDPSDLGKVSMAELAMNGAGAPGV